MGQAWSIAEEDLTFGAVIGEGAYGRVYSGMWGHVQVAIKVLRMPFDELDAGMRDDFDREVRIPFLNQQLSRPFCLAMQSSFVTLCFTDDQSAQHKDAEFHPQR
jgi:hypothetical protein